MRGHTLSIVFLSENLKIYLTQEEGGGGELRRETKAKIINNPKKNGDDNTLQ